MSRPAASLASSASRRSWKASGRSPHNPTLDDFVVLPENWFAWEVCRAIAGQPGRVESPVCVFGPAGTGKTHLTRGMSMQFADHAPQPRIACVSGKDYADEVAKAARNNDLPSLRARYDRLDLFVLDGLEFVVGKSWLQDELLRTVEFLHSQGATCVLTSWCAPRCMTGVSARLRNHLVGGLAVSISLPGRDSRRALLKSICARRLMSLPSDSLATLADEICGSPRDLLDALSLLNAVARDSSGAITPTLASRYTALHDKGYGDRRMSTIATTVAAQFDLTVAELISSSRSQPVTQGRQISIYLARELTDGSLGEIGRFFGGRDHSTVLYACRRVAQTRLVDRRFDRMVNQIREAIPETN